MPNQTTDRNAVFDGRLVAPALAAALVILIGGASYRWLDHEINSTEPIRLDRPLSDLPLNVGEWKGTELQMSQRVLEVAGCDDYIYRRYTDDASRRQIDLYVAYAARPAKMLGHRPEVCYPTHGWTPGEVRKESLTLDDGTTFEYLIRTVSHGERPNEKMVVLNYYILEGRIVTNWTDFWGPKYRMPNLSRDPSFYVAQTQVTANVPIGMAPTTVETWVKQFAALTARELVAFFPKRAVGSEP
ncbi:MAG TPA: EpsI family protein [Phycisphaerae bacterium]|nr:EpsI family protein [Phycisphaerae bacterium]HPZ98254.1 EpsI family protein [Phycisphaerae bacterium]HQE29400.1 EpsI family protein [Phycisphaerae bacterium]